MTNTSQLRRSIARVACTLTLAQLASACIAGAAPDAAGDPVETQTEAIVNGDSATATTAETNGWIKLIHNNASLCTATLIRNDLVLTARHCVTTDGTQNGPIDTNFANTKLTMGTQANVMPAAIFSDPPIDAAILQLKTFFSTTGGSRYDFVRSLYTGTNVSLINKLQQCYGYGYSSYPGTGTSGVLRTATNMQVLDVIDNPNDPTTYPQAWLVYTPNALNQIQWRGDGGGSCLYNGAITGLTFGFSVDDPPGVVTAAYQVGPATYRSFFDTTRLTLADASIYTATSTNITGNKMSFDHPDANGKSGALVLVTQNVDPRGGAVVYNPRDVGAAFQTTTSKWAVFNKDNAAMPANASFNISVGGTAYVHTVPNPNPDGSKTTLNNKTFNANPNALIMVTQQDGATNNSPVGVAYNASLAKWQIVNENGAAMLTGLKFTVRVVTSGEASMVQTATDANLNNVFGVRNTTYIDNPLLNGQPNAQIFVTHSLGTGTATLNHPIGVFYDSARMVGTVRGQWAIFTEEGGNIPIGTQFNVLIRP